MDKSKNLYGHLFALTANVMWGLMSPIGKSALQEFSPIPVCKTWKGSRKRLLPPPCGM